MRYMLKDRGHLAPEWLVALRVKGDDVTRARDWPTLHELTSQLRRDEQMWPELWGAWCAVAAREVGDPSARALLEEIIEAGFHQPENFADIFEPAFGNDPDWPELLDRMARNQPPAPITITEWPSITPGSPMVLSRLDDQRAAQLRELIPGPAEGAFETVKQLLAWVSQRWTHANAHMEVDDAVLCLRRVEAGARFACDEYSLVLSQSLNALGIPARKVGLRQTGYHAGIGRGHVICEGWIDDLARWVALDAQNGLFWTDEAGTPLGILELRDWLREGKPRPTPFRCTDKEFTEQRLDFWFSYFAHANGPAGAYADRGFVPVFQRAHVSATPRLVRAPEELYPDLSEVDTGIALLDGALALQFTAAHPFATGFAVDGVPCEGLWPVDATPGSHEIGVQTVTGFGPLRAHRVSYRVSA